MTTSIPNEHWVFWFLYLNAGILALLGLMALVKILDSLLTSEPPGKSIVFYDEFDGDF